MYLVDRDWGVQPVSLLTCVHPLLVRPLVLLQVPHYRCRLRPQFGVKPVRVGLYVHLLSALYLELVQVSLRQGGYEKLPYAATATAAHGVQPAVPTVKISYYADATGVWGPHGEVYALHVVHQAEVCAEFLVLLVMRALAHQVQVKVAQQWREAVRVLVGALCPCVVLGSQQVREDHVLVAKNRLEKPLVVYLLHLDGRLAAQHPCLAGTWLKRPYHNAAREPPAVNAEELMRVVVPGR